MTPAHLLPLTAAIDRTHSCKSRTFARCSQLEAKSRMELGRASHCRETEKAVHAIGSSGRGIMTYCGMAEAMVAATEGISTFGGDERSRNRSAPYAEK